MEPIVELGMKIRTYRKAKGLSQEQLAEQCELSLHQMSDIENGKTNMKYDTLMKLCCACEIDTGELPKYRMMKVVFA